ncbi:hypothetical protein BY996DRAFT_6961574 [Phakopsora pachyrhizi]|nr:hypothetical protein BY996DRAFT_6961574 [Phakopsora pachyrhizi]
MSSPAMASKRSISPSNNSSNQKRMSGAKHDQDNNFNLDTMYHYLDQTKRNAEVHVLSPIQAIFKDAFKNYPTLTSFVMVFSGLSMLPILSFLGFSLFTFSILGGMSLMFMLTWGGVIFGSALALLMTTLAFLAVASFWVVIGSFFSIMAMRLLYNTQRFFLGKLKESRLAREWGQRAGEKMSQNFQPAHKEGNEKPQSMTNGQH